MAVYLSNAFSLNMFSVEDFTLLRIRKVAASDVPQAATSAVGHADTARVISGMLGYEIIVNRINVSLQADDVLYVAQYKGPRLAEGATQLPEGATIEFFEVTLKPQGCSNCPAHDCNSCSTMIWTHGG